MQEPFSHSYANHFVEREVFEDENRLLPKTVIKPYRSGQFRSQWYDSVPWHTSLWWKGSDLLSLTCAGTKKAIKRIRRSIWSPDYWHYRSDRRIHLEMDGTAIPMGKGRSVQIIYVELWKKASISDQYHTTQCQNCTVYHEPVRWPGVQYPII